MGLNKKNRLRKSIHFRYIYEHGKRLFSKNFVLYYSNQPFEKRCKNVRIGLTVTRKQGNAVTRNRIKRLLREAIRPLINQLIEPLDVIIVAKKGVMQKTVKEINVTLFNCFESASLLKDFENEEK